MEKFTLHNGITIPALGYGTFKTEENVTAKVVKESIETGYRHIDAAAIYGNEKAVGQGIKNSGINREELFVTGKLWNEHRGYENTLKAFQQTLNDLQLEYLDLYLIHWPANEKQFANWKELNNETWRALEKLYADGKVKSIGVSNFLPHHLDSLFEFATVKPMVNQIEIHPGYQQQDLVKYSQSLGMVVEAWGSLGQSRLLDNPTLKTIGEKHGKSAAQVSLRWLLQRKILPLAKSITQSRIQENFEVSDFILSEEDMVAIKAIPQQGFSGLNPDEVDF
ncbi:oxidoreductase [Flavobacterium akiainvivens]|uniref:Oxidoreductase n=1 Tax=Flavobacterium akiainvivens TaxID=1202724 RepID=A0A0M8MFX2_9FLAO|nr:aldo/keto reductase [Flavobacterium akiainvivens]KOS04768.1 oxidoreductase [Flavobacterium akiainvivens]SFQ66499.1 Aldo/keto reductase [Flavobacterium akiainvivens]